MTMRVPAGTNESLRALATMLDELACEERLELLCLLAEGPVDVSGLCTRLDLAMPTVSGHLRHLMRLGLLECRKNGRWRIYALSDAARLSHAGATIELTLNCGPHVRCTFTLPRAALARLTPTPEIPGRTESPSTHAPAHPTAIVIRPLGDPVPRQSAASSDRPASAP